MKIKVSFLICHSFFSNKLTNPFNFRYNLSKKNQLQVKELPTVNFIIKKELFKKLGGFDKKFWPGEDTILCDNINKLSKIIIFLIYLFIMQEEIAL